MSEITVALDAGHGGSDYGATYEGRKEKDDVLRLVRAVGKILEDNGINVYYVRTDDEYETPFKKATDANNSGADYFVSIHRNSSERDNQYSGVETLVYNDDGVKAVMARNINAELEKVGFKNLGVKERPNLVVLKRTKMPAVLVEVGFINTDADNELFDERFNDIAQGIANGIIKTVYSQNPSMTESTSDENTFNYSNLNEYDNDTHLQYNQNYYNNYVDEYNNNNVYNNNDYSNNAQPVANKFSDNDIVDKEEAEQLYRVQVGAYRMKENADRMLNSLLIQGFPAFIIYDDGYYKVQVGAYRYLTNAIKMERRLRRFRYNTYIVYS